MGVNLETLISHYCKFTAVAVVGLILISLLLRFRCFLGSETATSNACVFDFSDSSSPRISYQRARIYSKQQLLPATAPEGEAVHKIYVYWIQISY